MPSRLDLLPNELMDEVLDYVGRHNLTPATFMGKMLNKHDFNKKMNKLYLKEYDNRYDYEYLDEDGDYSTIDGNLFIELFYRNINTRKYLVCNMDIEIIKYEDDDITSIRCFCVGGNVMEYFADIDDLTEEFLYGNSTSSMLRHMKQPQRINCLWCEKMKQAYDNKKVDALIEEYEDDVLEMIFEKDEVARNMRYSKEALHYALPMSVNKYRLLEDDGNYKYGGNSFICIDAENKNEYK
jgi:hypothetical protein